MPPPPMFIPLPPPRVCTRLRGECRSATNGDIGGSSLALRKLFGLLSGPLLNSWAISSLSSDDFGEPNLSFKEALARLFNTMSFCPLARSVLGVSEFRVSSIVNLRGGRNLLIDWLGVYGDDGGPFFLLSLDKGEDKASPKNCEGEN